MTNDEIISDTLAWYLMDKHLLYERGWHPEQVGAMTELEVSCQVERIRQAEDKAYEKRMEEIFKKHPKQPSDPNVVIKEEEFPF